MNGIPVLTIEDVATLDGVLGEFLKKAEADLTVVIDRGGNVISQFGDRDVMDVTIIAALAAGAFAATRELARRIGEVEFNALYHQGNGSHMFMNSVDEDTIMITVFGTRTTVGLVRFYSTAAAHSVADILKRLQRSHGLELDASDFSTEPIFSDAGESGMAMAPAPPPGAIAPLPPEPVFVPAAVTSGPVPMPGALPPPKPGS